MLLSIGVDVPDQFQVVSEIVDAQLPDDIRFLLVVRVALLLQLPAFLQHCFHPLLQTVVLSLGELELLPQEVVLHLQLLYHCEYLLIL